MIKNVSENETNGKQKYIVLGVLFLAWTIGYLDRTAINMGLVSIAKEFKINSIMVGATMSAFYLSYSFMQPIGGILADKIGSRIVLIISVFMWSLFTGLTGFASSFVTLLIIRFFFGFGEGGFPTASSVTVADWFKREERTRAKSVILTGSVLGGLLGSVAAGFMITQYGWRSMFHILGFLGIAITILFIIFVKQPEGIKEKKQKMNTKKISAFQVIKSPMVLMVTIAWFAWSEALWGASSWLPTYWVTVRKMSLTNTGIISALPGVLGIFAMISSGFLVDKFFKGKEKHLGFIGVSVSMICMLITFYTKNTTIAIIANSLSSPFSAIVSPVIFCYPLKYVPETHVGAATGIINFAGMFSAVFSTTIVGIILKYTNNNFSIVALFFAGCMLIAAISLLCIKLDKKISADIAV